MAFLGPLARGCHLSCHCHPVAPPSNWSPLLWCPSPLCQGFGSFACPGGDKTQRAVLVPSPGGFPWLSLPWEEERRRRMWLWTGWAMETLLAVSRDVPETFPAFCSHQDINVSHSRSALRTEGAFERSSVHHLTPMCITAGRINGNLYILVTRHSLCVS